MAVGGQSENACLHSVANWSITREDKAVGGEAEKADDGRK